MLFFIIMEILLEIHFWTNKKAYLGLIELGLLLLNLLNVLQDVEIKFTFFF